MDIHMNWEGHGKVVQIDDFVAAVDEVVAGDAVAIALTDLDDFSAINDEFGHEVGDQVLDIWVRTLQGSLPAGAIVRRLGGDEFAIALPGASAESALIILEEIRQHLASQPLEVTGLPVVATIGLAARPPHAEQTTDVVRCANAALMRGKREGRGGVVLYVEEKMVLKSNYYRRADLDRLSRLSAATSRTEASLLREGLDDLLEKYRDER
jgi:diguanylate cyclase